MAYRPKDTQERIIHRLKIARGQLDAVIKMVVEDKYCIDVIHQSKAVQEALKQIDNIMLENHLQTCVGDSFKSGNQKKATEELMRVFRKN
ncbi:MAG: metal-sensing transcriptional repressor [Candidatus Levybacteria bacterium]|nr:metal-sensing transcriptional repressor [Candidatus Levybacteria bacterium]